MSFTRLETPAPPVLNSVLGEDVAKFETACEEYLQKVSDLNLKLTSSQQITAAGYTACLSRELLRSLVTLRTFPESTSPEEVTNVMIKEWIKSRLRCSTEEMPSLVSEAVKKVHFIPNSDDPEGACLQFFIQLTTELRKNRVVHAIDDASEALINQVLPKLEPAILREIISSSMEYWPMYLRHDFHHFVKKVSETSLKCSSFLVKRPIVEQSDGTKMENSHKKAKREQAGSSDIGGSKQEVGECEQSSAKPAPLIVHGREWKTPCLNPQCDGVHPLKQCDNTSKEKKRHLFKEHRQKKQSRSRNRSNGHSYSEPVAFDSSSSEDDWMY